MTDTKGGEVGPLSCVLWIGGVVTLVVDSGSFKMMHAPGQTLGRLSKKRPSRPARVHQNFTSTTEIPLWKFRFVGDVISKICISSDNQANIYIAGAPSKVAPAIWN